MGFSSRLVAHRHLLTLETLRFIADYLDHSNARLAALNSGIPEKYASRQGQWLKKHPMVVAAIERELNEDELLQLQQAVQKIEILMDECKILLGLDERSTHNEIDS